MGKWIRHVCPWNEEISCTRKTCVGCSWDPAEHQKRMEMIREQVKRGEVPHVSVQKRDTNEL